MALSNIFFLRKLAGRTIFITGASRGIGKAIALKAARDGANIVVAAKTAEPHPKLPGTIYSAAKESMCMIIRNHFEICIFIWCSVHGIVEEAGGQALPCILDVRDEKAVKAAVASAVEKVNCQPKYLF